MHWALEARPRERSRLLGSCHQMARSIKRFALPSSSSAYLMRPAAGKWVMACTKSKMLSGLRCFSPKTASMMFKGQIAIAIDLHQFRRDRAEPQDNMRRMPKRAAISSAPKPRFSASFLKASNRSAGCTISRVTFSSRLISCGSFAVSMQRIGSVFLISLRFTLRSQASRLQTPWPPFSVQPRFDHQILRDTLGGDSLHKLRSPPHCAGFCAHSSGTPTNA